MAELAASNPDLDRSASFRCVIALSFPVGHPKAGEDVIELGEMPGRLIEEVRGEGGFGYDPIFIPEGLALTSAEIGAQEKDRISHRGRAMRRIAPILVDLL